MSPHPDAALARVDRAWLYGRAAALGLHPGQVHGVLTAGAAGRIVLSTDAAASAVPAAGPDGSAVFAAEMIRVGAGESLVVRCPDRRPVALVAGALEVAAGGSVVFETRVSLEAGHAAFGANAPMVLVGRDGAPGAAGVGGEGDVWDAPGGHGQPGLKGEDGQAGPGGEFSFTTLSGTLTIIAGGGNGGDGGPGGKGGLGGEPRTPRRGERGGDGGPGGPGGKAGDGGTVLVRYASLEAGAAIHIVARVPVPGVGGPGGHGGDGGEGNDDAGSKGAWGPNGAPGAPGDPPTFLLRPGA